MGYLDDQVAAITRPPRRPRSRILWVLLIVVVVIAIVTLTAMQAHLHTGHVTVVRAEGTLVTGLVDSSDSTGSEVIGDALRAAADDPMTDAIVLRVNSPGGTPSAAEEIIGDIEYAKTKKPVVVSMGDIATSAAYLISVHADRIYANPDTFTANIGTIWTFSDDSEWMKKKGYQVEVVKSGEMKDMGSSTRSLTTEERDYAQQLVNASFESFISDVLTHRPVNRTAIEDGRVIRGQEALDLGLVDELGNLNDAEDAATDLAKTWSP
jgi:protease-4